MRRRIAGLVVFFLCLLLGVALLGLAVFAYQIGIDNDPGWGSSRYVIAASGSLLLIVALALRIGPGFVGTLVHSMWYQRLFTRFSTLAHSRPVTAIGRVRRNADQILQRVPVYQALSRSAGFFAGLGFAIVLLIYLWYLTSGTMTTWTPYSSYFDKLGSAFYAGQLHLLERPPDALLALDNPYDYRNREGIGYLWDALLYQGKYYYYWGPVPGLAVWMVKLIAGPQVVVEDQHLILAFTTGLNLVVALLLLRLRAVLYPNVPAWTLLALVLLAGLAVPVLWLVNRPSVYEVAIAGGQFFLLLGLFAAVRYVTRLNSSPAWLLIAGLAWGAAVNCRLNLALAVGFFCLLLAWREFRSHRQLAPAVTRIAWLAAPLIIWAAAAGWYNAARFGSVLETGHRYQLTGMALTGNYSDTFSAAYILPSLYSYLIRPLAVIPGDFPFVFAPFIQESMWPWWIRLPEHYYYPEPVAGVLAAVPAIWAVFLPLLGWAREGWLWINEYWEPRRANPAERWVGFLLAGGAVSLLLPLLMFISSSMRYLADVVPVLVILAAIGYWSSWTALRSRTFWRGVLSLAVLLLIISSIVMSLLANFTNGDKRFEANNPALYYHLARLFTGSEQ